MGKKKPKKETSKSSYVNDSVSFIQEEGDSSHSSLSCSNISLEEKNVPVKFTVSSVDSAGCGAYANFLKSDFKDVVFLHPSVMRLYNIEDLVVVQGEEKKVLCVSLPLKHIKKSLIVFPKECVFKNQELVGLSPYVDKVREAEEILISFCNEQDDSQNVKELIRKLLCFRHIYVGLNLQWKFFDRHYTCFVKDITASYDIADLSLNETSDSCAPKFYTINYKTLIKLESEIKHCENKTSDFSYIGGLEKQISSLNKWIQPFLKSKVCISSTFCGTIMLHGPPGTGKSLVLNAFSKEYNISKEYIVWYRILSKSQSEIDKQLKFIFQRAVERAPSLIIIDDFHHLCPSKTKAESLHLHMSKILSRLIAEIDNNKILIIAAANSDYDETVLQTSRRLMEVIEFQIPSSEERVDILQKLLAREKHDLTFEQIKECAEILHGYTGKNLFGAITDAEILAKYQNPEDEDETIRYRYLKQIVMKLRKPTIATTGRKVKKVQWSDIGGMNIIKEKLKQLIEWPIKYPEVYRHFGATPARGVLMFGPPGCSKTMIAKALATECELNFISKNVSDIYDKYVGESEKAIRDLFSLARSKAPCIIFLDEIDALGSERGSSSGDSGVGDRIVSSLLTEMDGMEELRGVIILAATNRPDVLDNALIRYGRLSNFIYVPLPDAEAREEILKISMKNRLISDDFDFKLLSAKTVGYSGAEIVNVCNEAALQLLIEDFNADSPTFQMCHFEKALNNVPPRTDKELIKCCENFYAKFCI